MWDISSYRTTASVGGIEFMGTSTEDVFEENTYIASSHIVRPSKYQEFEGSTFDFKHFTVIALTDTEYGWIDIEEPDFISEIDFLNHRLHEKEEIIKDLKIQIDGYKNELKSYKRKIPKFERLNRIIKIKNKIILKLKKDIIDYKQKLDRFTIDFSLPEGYYSDEEFNEL